MDAAERERCTNRLRTALRLFEDGLALKRAQLRREHPDWSEERLGQELDRWLREKPGAEHWDLPEFRLRPLPEEP